MMDWIKERDQLMLALKMTCLCKELLLILGKKSSETEVEHI